MLILELEVCASDETMVWQFDVFLRSEIVPDEGRKVAEQWRSSKGLACGDNFRAGSIELTEKVWVLQMQTSYIARQLSVDCILSTVISKWLGRSCFRSFSWHEE